MNQMKRVYLSALAVVFIIAANAQTASVTETVTVTKTVNEEQTEPSLVNDSITKSETDTTYVRIGKHNIEIVEKDGSTHIDFNKDGDDKDDHKKHWNKKRKNSFNGHWDGFELGFNQFYDTDYRMYPLDQDFMDLKRNKSIEVNFNFAEFNIDLQKKRNNIGLVTGLGLSINNYRFDQNLTIDKFDGRIIPVYLDSEGLKKTKFVTSYLTIPLLLEFQIPVNNYSNKLHIAGGIMGGINIGSYTKIKTDSSKTKDRGDFNANLFKYAATARVGLKDFSIYANYNLSPLFEENKGPELYTFSIGICLTDFD